MGCGARHSDVLRVAGALPPKGGVPGPPWCWMDAPAGAGASKYLLAVIGGTANHEAANLNRLAIDGLKHDRD
jgi:hypothetical protein